MPSDNRFFYLITEWFEQHSLWANFFYFYFFTGTKWEPGKGGLAGREGRMKKAFETDIRNRGFYFIIYYYFFFVVVQNGHTQAIK